MAASRRPRGKRTGRSASSRQALIRDHGQSDALAGLISVLGVKYTTARLVAEGAVDLALPQAWPPGSALRDRAEAAAGRPRP